jgi:serine protease Do
LVPICILYFAILSVGGALVTQAAAQSTEPLEAREETALKAAAENVAPSVVQIRTIGGLESVDGTILADGPTTGLVISPDGYILASAFNFAQQPASILVMFASGKQAPAELVATDHSRMLVLLKASGVSDLRVPPMTPLDEMKPGQWAVAVGRTFRADRINVTVGIVSALERMLGKVIQTDADVSLANYGGPLVDIRGRVIGIIVPMAPQASSEVAGAEWYDSGIGFAVPLAGFAERIEQLKKGKDLRPGLLGIGMTPKSPHSSPAELAAVRPDSPAGQAGLKKGDRIVEINGKPIKTQTALRFALGTAYGGDTVKLVAMRGKERIERTITLIGEMPAYRHAFLGILPMRPEPEAVPPSDDKDNAEKKASDKKETSDDEKKADKSPKGIVVRMIYEGSPAAEAAIQPGDRIVRINEAEVDSVDDAIGASNSAAPGNKIAVQLIRNNQTMDVTLTAARLPANVPNELPPAYPAKANAQPAAKATDGEIRDLKLPEFSNKCRIYVPAAHETGRPQAAVLWLQSQTASDAKPDDVIRQWQSVGERDGILLVVPSPNGKERWERTDLEYLRRLAERLVAQYKIDPHRMVVCGHGRGGTIAWQAALSFRDLFRGVVAIASPPPRSLRVPPNDPSLRLAIVAALPANKENAAPIALGLRKFDDAGYNLATMTTTSSTGQLSDDERNVLARWIDTLDRF